MKRIVALVFLFLLLMMSVTSCEQSDAGDIIVSQESDVSGNLSWENYYDLGVRYLSEGNYEEAIIAFTAAIEIDSMKAPAYFGRGQAYAFSGETAENLVAAEKDFETATRLDEANPDAWLGLADIYIQRGDFDKALSILQTALEKTGNADKVSELLEQIMRRQDSFYSSEKYIEYENLSEQWQEYLSELYDAFTQNDPLAVQTVLQNRQSGDEEELFVNEHGSKVLYTELYGYKISWMLNSSETYVQVEMRPREGKGYIASFNSLDLLYTNELYHSTSYLSGECSNWNWNGAYESHDWRGNEEWFQEWRYNGEMKDCLLNGTHRNRYWQSDFGEDPIWDVESIYEYGQNISDNETGETGYETAFFPFRFDSIEEAISELWWD